MIRLCHGNTVGSGECHLSMADLGPPCPSNTGSLLACLSSIGTNRFHHALEQHSTSNEPYCMFHSEVRVIHWVTREKSTVLLSLNTNTIPLVVIVLKLAACCSDSKWLIPCSALFCVTLISGRVILVSGFLSSIRKIRVLSSSLIFGLQETQHRNWWDCRHWSHPWPEVKSRLFIYKGANNNREHYLRALFTLSRSRLYIFCNTVSTWKLIIGCILFVLSWMKLNQRLIFRGYKR